MVVAIILGLTAANIFRPGAGLQLEMFQIAMQRVRAGQMAFPIFLLTASTRCFRIR